MSVRLVLFRGLSEERLEEEAAQQICKLLNVGHGDMQLRTPIHTAVAFYVKESFEEGDRSLGEEFKRFFKVFEESTFEGSWAARREK
jgi:hypothetical protein